MLPLKWHLPIFVEDIASDEVKHTAQQLAAEEGLGFASCSLSDPEIRRAMAAPSEAGKRIAGRIMKSVRDEMRQGHKAGILFVDNELTGNRETVRMLHRRDILNRFPSGWIAITANREVDHS